MPQRTRTPFVHLTALALAWVVVACGGDPGGSNALTVAISSPSTTAYSATTLTVQVAVTGAPDAVELHRDGDLLVALTAPYTYVWSTAGEAEGSHELTAVARRGGSQVVSEPRTVVVDRTRPTVAARTPAPGDDNVWIGAPIVVTFSEPLRPATLTAGTVALEVEGGSPIAATLAAGADGRSVTLTPDGPIAVPATVRMTLSDAIVDLAGNALVAPPPWSWTLPRWQWMGGTALRVDDGHTIGQARLAVDPEDRPLTVWLEERGGTVPPSDVQAAAWDGQAWEGLGGRLNGDDRVGPMYGSQDVAVASDGTVVVAWTTPVSGVPDSVWVHRWSGSAWEAIGGGPINDPTSVPVRQHVSLVLDDLDRPVVAWDARPGGLSAAADVRVSRWTGSAWVAVGTPRRRDPTHVSFRPFLALDAAGRPIVAWSERLDDTSTHDVFVDRWSGSAWTPLGGSLRVGSWTAAFVNDLATGPNGELHAALTARLTSGTRVAVRRWSEGGDTWFGLGSTLEATPDGVASAASLKLDGDGRSLLFWHERVPGDGGSDVGRFQLWRYETAVWRDLQFPVTTAAAYVGLGGDVTTSDTGEVFVAAAWPDADGLRHHLRVYRSNGVP
jgi:hypothetical protein